MNEKKKEQGEKKLGELSPKVFFYMWHMLGHPATPPATQMAIINLVVERILGKNPATINLETDRESIENAEIVLKAMVEEVQKHGELRPNWREEAGLMPRADEEADDEEEDSDDEGEWDNGD